VNIIGWIRETFGKIETWKILSQVIYQNDTDKAIRIVGETIPINSNGEPLNELPLESNGGIPVNVQDQSTPAIIQKFNRVTNSTTLASPAVKYVKTISVIDATGISAGSHIILFDPVSIRFSSFTALIVVSTTITLDTPIDFDYPAGTFVDIAITNMAVNGAITPQIFGLRGTGVPPGVELTFDVTRLIFKCFTLTAPDFGEFGDLTKLTNGLVLRKRDGGTYNIFNVKDNGEIAGIMFDFNFISAIGSGQDGFISRLTFGGQSKLGVVQRLSIGEDLELIIQDDLSGLTLLEITAEGHITQD
jgi:hypothetical protein